MKSSLLSSCPLLLVLALTGCRAAAPSGVPGYRGLTPGVTTLDEMADLLGEPERAPSFGQGGNYEYADFTVSYQEPGPEINTVVVHGDASYETPTGVGLGSSRSEVAATIADRQETSRPQPAWTDRPRNLTYWFDSSGRVEKIVLVNFEVMWGKKREQPEPSRTQRRRKPSTPTPPDDRERGEPPVYRGVTAGVTSLARVQELFGQPRDIRDIMNGERHVYDEFFINYADLDDLTVNTIVIFGDEEYETTTGVRLWDDRKKVLATLEPLELERVQPTYAGDHDASIAYAIRNGEVAQIVLGSGSLRR
ncbi:MAG: hypothetical protein AAF533_10330 [Acidobacteriota bacterium]